MRMQIAQWLPCLTDGLGIHAFIWRGWQRKPLAYMGDSGHDCWWAPPGMSCAAFEAAATDAAGQMQPVAASQLPDVSAAVLGHHTGASAQLKEFYSQEVADMVWDMYQADFSAFGYDRLVLP